MRVVHRLRNQRVRVGILRKVFQGGRDMFRIGTLRVVQALKATVMARYPRLVRSGVLSGLVVAILGAGQNASPQTPRDQGTDNSFQTPLRLIAEARQSYARVADYMCQ